MAKFLKLLVLIPLGLIIIAFAIANRQIVPVSIDPFSEPDPAAALIAAPLFLLLFLALIIGIVLGGIATWVTQGDSRRRARVARDEADHLREEVRRIRDQPTIVAPTARRLARTDYA